MISVCLASCNGAFYIKDQIASVLLQLSEGDELIIADDLSNDNTIGVVKAIADNRVTVLPSLKQRLGVVKNFERALLQARGEVIFLCDQDDIWLPGKVGSLLSSLEDSMLVVSDCKVVNSSLNVIHPSFFNIRHSKSGVVNNLIKNSYLGCCMAFRRELLQYALPIPKYVPMHDMWLGLIAETRGKVSFLPKALLLYRRHGQNASPTASKSNFNLYQKVTSRLRLSVFLLARFIRNLFL